MSATEDPGSRRGPLGYARDRAPARCRFRSTRFLPRSTGRLVDPPASPRVPGCRRSKPKERGRSEVKRSRAGPPHGEPRTEPPSEAAEQDPRPLAVVPLVGGAPPFLHPGYELGVSPPSVKEEK